MLPDIQLSLDPTIEQAARYSLLDALSQRRSRRFGQGFQLNGGPLAYKSSLPPPTSDAARGSSFSFCGLWTYRLYDGRAPLSNRRRA